MKSEQQVTYIPTKHLHFDPKNPRFYRLNDKNGSDDSVIEAMLDTENIQDLMASIGQKGYFPGEPLLVVGSQRDGEIQEYVVVEGNRRLASVKLLNKEILPPKGRQASLKLIGEAAIESPPYSLPCLVFTERREILRYLGYRHITGIKQWDSLSKAKYLRELRDQFYEGMDEGEQLKNLARDIGSRPSYVGQLLTALELYSHAESVEFFGLPIKPKDIEFSYITTALNYSNICAWLGLKGRVDIEMPALAESNLKKTFGWMFSQDPHGGGTVLGESRRLEELAAVVGSSDATRVLEDTKNLAEAYLYTSGPEAALGEALKEAKDRVRLVWNMLPRTKPLTASHREFAQELLELSKDVRDHIQKKLED